MIVVDTNVTSELMKPSPSAVVTSWVGAQPHSELFTTSITVAEVLYGIERLPEGRRKSLLRGAAEDVFSTYVDQLLTFDRAAATEYARVVSDRERSGRPIDGFDAQIASICRVHGATLATRNVEDFRDTDVEVIDPWRAAG